MRVAIVGSRDFEPLDWVREYVRELPPGTVVISGGARGPDRVAVETARECGLEVVEHCANWKRYGRAAGMLRNSLIVADCERVVAFWDGVSRGTADTVAKAQLEGKDVTVYQSAWLFCTAPGFNVKIDL